MSQALYRKYRSRKLSEVIGQDHITAVLSRALEAGRIAHAYLLTGPRGVGKTSIARILAHEINNLPYSEDDQNLDIIEIDAASNTGIDDIRDLREKAQIAPVMAAKKIYIIDEVHMLSKAAFNGLLKTLEEPPKHVVFILATTNVEKLPDTIISRTQQFSFRAINADDIKNHLKTIAQKEKILINDDALALVAQRGGGSFRDSISLLDQLASLSSPKEAITLDLVQSTLGLAAPSVVDALIKAVKNHDIASVAQLLNQTEAEGLSGLVVCDQLIETIKPVIATKPELLNLLDSLLEVPRSSYPYVKLLSVLGTAASENKPKNAALRTPVAQISATVEQLSQAAAEPTVKVRQPVVTQQPPTIKQPPGAKQPAVVRTVKTVNTTQSKEAKIDQPFNWQGAVDFSHQNCIALYSVLSKCSYEIQDLTIIIFAKNAFYKKKLDDPKYNKHLRESVNAAGGYELTIHTVATAAPLKSSQAAAIADIMGGGIEVSLEAIA